MSEKRYHIFTKQADARREVDEAVEALAREQPATGFHKSVFVTRANQTVVFVTDRDAPLAAVLRERPGWHEPEQ
jgi:hypothetical protein